ncbi:MAG: aldehyde-activating protein [Hyphomicrobiales bacterium]|nr:MAG: aldehyde-activating protein [Hyphomicrobiales bacterium]
MAKGFSGGCLCGAVRFECTAEPQSVLHCHCIDCRKSSGTGHGTHVAVPREAFSVSGDVTTYERAADSGNIVSRRFCPVCGSPVYSTTSGMPDHVFPIASALDDPDFLEPEMIVYARRAPWWDYMDPSLPALPGDFENGEE